MICSAAGFGNAVTAEPRGTPRNPRNAVTAKPAQNEPRFTAPRHVLRRAHSNASLNYALRRAHSTLPSRQIRREHSDRLLTSRSSSRITSRSPSRTLKRLRLPHHPQNMESLCDGSFEAYLPIGAKNNAPDNVRSQNAFIAGEEKW